MQNNLMQTKAYHTQLARLACVLAFAVILLGAYTRLTNAGLSCPDWPNCYGYLTAPHTAAQLTDAASRYPSTPVNIKKAWTEMGHRYLAGTEGILILILAIGIGMHYKKYTPQIVMCSVLLVILLCAQVLLGMLTVTAKLNPGVVLSHLLIGLSILNVLWWLALSLREPRHHWKGGIRVPLLLIGLIIIAAQIALGGWVSTHSAGLACIDFPYCRGELIPTLAWHHWDSDLITIHMLHRLGAMITAIYFVIMTLFLLRTPRLQKIGIALLILIALQITLGITNILWLRPIAIALAHVAVAILLLLTTLTGLRWEI